MIPLMKNKRPLTLEAAIDYAMTKCDEVACYDLPKLEVYLVHENTEHDSAGRLIKNAAPLYSSDTRRYIDKRKRLLKQLFLVSAINIYSAGEYDDTLCKGRMSTAREEGYRSSSPYAVIVEVQKINRDDKSDNCIVLPFNG